MRTGIAFFFDKVSFLKHPNLHINVNLKKIVVPKGVFLRYFPCKDTTFQEEADKGGEEGRRIADATCCHLTGSQMIAHYPITIPIHTGGWHNLSE